MPYNKRGYGLSVGMYQGDPFLGGIIKGAGKLLGGGLKIAGGIVPGLGGTVLKTAGGLLAPTKRAAVQPSAFPIMPPSLGGLGMQGFMPTNRPPRVTKSGAVTTRKRPTMNPANPRALRRAIRRQDSFVKLARKALKGSGYQITTRASRRSRRDLGPGHSHVR